MHHAVANTAPKPDTRNIGKERTSFVALRSHQARKDSLAKAPKLEDTSFMAAMNPTRQLGCLTVCALAVASLSCASGTSTGAPAFYGPTRYASGGPNAAPAPPEGYKAKAARQHMSGLLFLPGSPRQQLVKYAVVEGQAVMEGDILLGPAAQVPFRYGLPRVPVTQVKSAVATSDKSHLWPGAEIPFVVDGSISPAMATVIQGAVAHLNTSPLKARPRRDGDRDFVVFRDTGDGCSSFVGRLGGPQDINVTSGCGLGAVVHEMLHASGFFHEQSRGDRDAFITIAFDEISSGFEDNFEKRDSRGQDIGPYDFGSLMHYSSRAFSRSGRPTIVAKVSGVTFGQREALSTLDRAAIDHLYGASAGLAAPAPAPAPGSAAPGPSPGVNQGSFAGQYASSRGNVSCTQAGTAVSCQYPAGSMLCSANGPRLDCGWSGGGQGRAVFQRQSSGLVTGTFGDFFSSDSRGAWSLTPTNLSPSAPPGPPPAPVPAPSTTGSVAGSYASTRGPTTCGENGASVTCSFQETPLMPGRLDCNKDASGTLLSCQWMTFLPPGSGRASFSRPRPNERTFNGTWGHGATDTGGGSWQLTGQ